MTLVRIKVWDLPTRLVHWSLVLLICAAIISGKLGGNAIAWHGRIGLTILGLLAFRIAWGFLGSTHARFANFIPTLSSLRSHLRGQWHGVGHNPLGAFSVFAMLAMIGLQLATGLLANDDIAFRGPLFGLIDTELSNTLTGIHKVSINVLIALIALHIGAILFYALIRKTNLVKAMFSGSKELAPEDANKTAKTTGGGPLAFIAALLIALASVYAGSGAWIPAAPPVPASAPQTPGW